MEEIAIGGSFEFTEINNKPKERRNQSMQSID